MKLKNSLILSILAGIGSATIVDCCTDGKLTDFCESKIYGKTEKSYWKYDSPNGIRIYGTKSANKTIEMPIADAVNLYKCIEEAISIINKSGNDTDEITDYNIFGNKAISFEKLYDALEAMNEIPVENKNSTESNS